MFLCVWAALHLMESLCGPSDSSEANEGHHHRTPHHARLHAHIDADMPKHTTTQHINLQVSLTKCNDLTLYISLFFEGIYQPVPLHRFISASILCKVDSSVSPTINAETRFNPHFIRFSTALLTFDSAPPPQYFNSPLQLTPTLSSPPQSLKQVLCMKTLQLTAISYEKKSPHPHTPLIQLAHEPKQPLNIEYLSLPPQQASLTSQLVPNPPLYLLRSPLPQSFPCQSGAKLLYTLPSIQQSKSPPPTVQELISSLTQEKVLATTHTIFKLQQQQLATQKLFSLQLRDVTKFVFQKFVPSRTHGLVHHHLPKEVATQPTSRKSPGERRRICVQLLLFNTLLLLTTCSFLLQAQVAAVSPMEDSLLELADILPTDTKSYDKMRPPRSNGNPTVVYFHVTVMSLDSIDESSMTYAADIFFAQSWKDPRLRFPSNMTGEYRLLPVSWLKDIWRPDSFFKNAKSVTFQTMTIPNHYIWLYQDSTILYMVKLTLLLSCAMTFQTYPHDTQHCAMKIESLSHTTADLVFTWDPEVPLVVDDSIELPQLDLVANTTGDCTQVYSTGNFTCLEVGFTFKRRLGYYLFHTYIPTCLIVIMSWISFWIKPEAVPARVTLGVTSLLTLSTQHANSQKSLPPVSYIKAVDMFMSSCTVFVFLSLMEYAVVNVILGDNLEMRKQESFVKRISRKLGKNGHRSSGKADAKKKKKKKGGEHVIVSEGGEGRDEFDECVECYSGEGGEDAEEAPPPTSQRTKRGCCDEEGNRGGVGGLMGLSHRQCQTGYPLHQHNTHQRHPPIVQNATTTTVRHASSNLNNRHQNNQNQRTSSPSTSSSVSREVYHPQHHHHHQYINTSQATPQSPPQQHQSPSPSTLPQINEDMSFCQWYASDGEGSTTNIPRSLAMEMREVRAKAILVDRFSRVFFPVSFTVLNILYWYIYFDW